MLVRPGLYGESLIISKKIELVGEGERQDIIVESRAGSCLLMRTDEALVRNLTLRGLAGASNTRPSYFAVDIPQGHLTIEECDITSNSLSCIGVHNDTTRPLIARCVIHSSADSGIYFFNAAAGEVLECDVHHNANVGVAVTDGASAFVNRCSIHEGADAGVVAWDGGTCTIEASEIYGNAKAGVGTSDRGQTLIRNSRLYGGENSGVFVHNKGQSILEGCEIFGHSAGEVAATLMVALCCAIAGCIMAVCPE
ncbi:MAG: right-handed parallel beta-helix repeat-containing protein [Pyrinomonadaceae bacterium]